MKKARDMFGKVAVKLDDTNPVSLAHDFSLFVTVNQYFVCIGLNCGS
jgi:hypothetical protein